MAKQQMKVKHLLDQVNYKGKEEDEMENSVHQGKKQKKGKYSLKKELNNNHYSKRKEEYDKQLK